MGDTSRNRYEGLDDFAVKLIRYKARRLVERRGFVRDDLPDIEQTLVLDVLQRLPRFDPARAGRSTFITRIVDHQVATLIEARQAAIRDFRKEAGSLDDRRRGDGNRREGPPVLRDDPFLRDGLAAAREAEGLHALQIDLRELLAGLPEEERSLCERLMTSSVSEISREVGIPRGTLYERIGRIRSRFEKAGLAVYLNSADTSTCAPVGKREARGGAGRRRQRR